MDQGLAVLGHCNVQENIHQIMRFRAEDIPKFQQWLESGEYIPITGNCELANSTNGQLCAFCFR